MGFIFESSQKIIWEPSSGTGKVFLEQLSNLERLTDCSAKIREVASDTFEVDPNSLIEFLKVSLERIAYNSSLQLLFSGLIVHLVALGLACGEKLASEFESILERDLFVAAQRKYAESMKDR